MILQDFPSKREYSFYLPTEIEPPKNLSGILELALQDLIKINRNRDYHVTFNTITDTLHDIDLDLDASWASSENQLIGYCQVNLSGTVCVNTLGIPIEEGMVHPTRIPSWEKTLYVIELLNKGSVSEAAKILNVKTRVPDRKIDQNFQPKNYRLYWTDINQLLKELKEEDLIQA